MVSQPGPGVAIITMPRASSVNPISTLTNRLACWNEWISTKSLASRVSQALVSASLAACSPLHSLDAIQPVMSRHARRFPSPKDATASKFLLRARRTVGLRDAASLESGRRGERWPQMERFCRVGGNTGPHAGANRSSRTSRSLNSARQRRLELVNDAHRSFRADLIGVEEPTGNAINRHS